MRGRYIGISSKVYLFIVTCGGIGYLPLMPGTYASAAGGILFFLFPKVCGNLLFVVLLVAFSTYCINRLKLPSEDPGYIVIDELCGIFITVAGHTASVVNVVAGFILFRFFDIVKPFPIRRVERFKKGYGIMADDVLSGIISSIILFMLSRIWEG